MPKANAQKAAARANNPQEINTNTMDITAASQGHTPPSPSPNPNKRPRQTPPSPVTAPPPLPNVMDIFNEDANIQGVSASIHAPKAETPVDNSVSRPIETMSNVEQTANMQPTPTPTEPESIHPDQALLEILATAEANMAVLSNVSLANQSTQNVTPPPENGFPTIHLTQSAQLFDNLDPSVLASWISAPDPKFLIRIFDYNGINSRDKESVFVGKIKAVIKSIAAPEERDEFEANISPPITKQGAKFKALGFLAQDIPRSITERVLEQRIWSTPAITFEARPFRELTAQTLLLCLQGFTTQDSNVVARAVYDAWNSTAARREIMHHLEKARDIMPNGVEHAYNSFSATLRVERISYKAAGGYDAPRFNVYATSPTKVASVWTDIRTYMRTLIYISPFGGTGKAISFQMCQLCKCISHPRGLCPFPVIPNWYGGSRDKPKQDDTFSAKNKGKGKQLQEDVE
ncbi:hypothetical protein BJ138DRAFT_1102940 [Hygrophoropsis aurantiaca]|uniref:Uncharacterized protein n=1 Tax=Hygrophoropsis aurantiaca TaxID=72124 RepID=A0ACB8A7V1_9AGAM|nr:hypothetical protein BJ138DRAFT_1102940 [Hygrophoropsis aurantiaca]